ncbi:MAG: malto-oligosyltrehalose trehalohydrolase [Deltaproteobacteria bacterium]|nr:malto-oligosyltrehalose trehalohydrolase [Deltaproteobacteria bacterium]
MYGSGLPTTHRRYPIGAERVPTGEVHFRVWSPRSKTMEVVVETGSAANTATRLSPEENGYFSGVVPGCKAGDLYRFRMDGHRLLLDPASRFQPEGPLGPSMVVDWSAFSWQDSQWPGVRIGGQVLYEMHIGTFTAEGTWRAASLELASLKELGITIIEVMPVHDFCGRFGWGYDGVDFFAPTRLYGCPDDFRAFVDQAHLLGLGVILDVVYNHAGPAGNFLRDFSADYLTDRYSTEWGEPFNFDGENSAAVREFFVTNAGYWIEEFHVDGLRLDATQSIYDSSERHILAEITERVRRAAGTRSTIVIAENEPQETRLVQPVADGGYGIDAVWNDDFHHSAMVALTGHNEAYYSGYGGRPQEFISAAKRGYLYQGQYCRWQNQRRGTQARRLKPAAFITYLQNHDQIANGPKGLRIHFQAHPGMYRAMTALMLLTPQTPLLFQGQEFAASAPFVFFADHPLDVAAEVKRGRLQFLNQFPSISSEAMRGRMPDPVDPATFESCRLDFSERDRHQETYMLHRDLLKLRREDPVFSAQRPEGVDGAVLREELFVLRFFGENEDDRLLLVNFDIDAFLDPVPEPLLAGSANRQWRVVWSSEDPRYGGSGALPAESVEHWFIPGRGAFVFKAFP